MYWYYVLTTMQPSLCIMSAISTHFLVWYTDGITELWREKCSASGKVKLQLLFGSAVRLGGRRLGTRNFLLADPAHGFETLGKDGVGIVVRRVHPVGILFKQCQQTRLDVNTRLKITSRTMEERFWICSLMSEEASSEA